MFGWEIFLAQKTHLDACQSRVDGLMKGFIVDVILGKPHLNQIITTIHLAGLEL